MDAKIEEFKAFLVGTRNCKTSTASSYASKLAMVCKYYDKELAEISSMEYQTFFIHLKKDKSINYQRLIQTAVKVFWDWCSKSYGLPNPVGSMRPIHKERIMPDILNRDEVLLMIDACGDKNILQIRNAAMICLLADTGIRVGELIALNMSSVIKEQDHFILKVSAGRDGTKSYRQRQIPFAHLKAGEVIAEYWSLYWQYLILKECRSASTPLFLSTGRGGWEPGRMSVGNVQHLIHRLSAKADITKKITPHSFRHFYATWFKANGGDLMELKERLGHASLDSTMLYVHLADLVKADNLKQNPMAGMQPLNPNMKQFVNLLKP